jgi:hypothetical protein
MEMTTVKNDVDDVTAMLLRMQAEDNKSDKGIENIDMSSSHRGAALGMNFTYLEIAKELDMGDNKYPESNVKDLCKRAVTKYIQHYIFMLISDAAMKHGFSEEDAIDFAAASYRRDKQIGRSDATILKGWL